MSASVNKMIILGNLTRSPQMKYLPNETPVCEFGVATNRKYKTAAGEDREEVCYFDLVAFQRQAEVINQYCDKGKPIFIEARAKYESWDDKNGGGKRSKLVFVVENFQLLGDRREGEAQDGAEQGDEQPAPAARQLQRRAQPAGRDQRF